MLGALNTYHNKYSWIQLPASASASTPAPDLKATTTKLALSQHVSSISQSCLGVLQKGPLASSYLLERGRCPRRSSNHHRGCYCWAIWVFHHSACRCRRTKMSRHQRCLEDWLLVMALKGGANQDMATYTQYGPCYTKCKLSRPCQRCKCRCYLSSRFQKHQSHHWSIRSRPFLRHRNSIQSCKIQTLFRLQSMSLHLRSRCSPILSQQKFHPNDDLEAKPWTYFTSDSYLQTAALRNIVGSGCLDES